MAEAQTDRTPVSDNELASLAASGDTRAFEMLAGRYRSMMYGVCRRITCNDEDAIDALQDSLIIMWQRIGSFEGRSAVSTWLFRIAANAAVDEMRRRARRPVSADAAIADRSGPDDVESAVVLRSTVDWALGQLPPQFRAAVVLRETYDCSYQQIADILGVPIDTVKSRISRGRQALSGLLLPSYGSGD